MKRANEQAFPANLSDTEGGMTLREYFAGLAMQGLLASRINVVDLWRIDSEEIACEAVRKANALIAALEKP